MTTSKLLAFASALLLAAAGFASAEEPVGASPADELVAELPAEPVEEIPGESAGTEPSDSAGAEPAEMEPASAEPADAAPSEATAEAPAAMPEEAAGGGEAEADAGADPTLSDAASTPSEDPAAAAAEIPTELADSDPMTDPAAAEPEVEAAAPEQALGEVGYDQDGRQGRIHVVVSGDTLWDVSDAYLGTPWVWPSIWKDNQEIENPHLIFPDDRIWITPWEMRKITAAEAEALLAGSPAAADPEPMAAAEPEELAAAPALTPVRAEQPTFIVSNREMVGLVTAETVEASASVVSAVVKDKVMLSQDDRVWIGIGEDETEKGDQFTIFRVQEKVYDPETGRMLGYHVNFLGWTEVTEVHAETASAVIRESTLDIEIGDRLMRRTPPVEEIAIQPSPDDVDGQISFMAYQRTLVGSLEFVYLNRGTLDGIEVGSPLQVYRQSFKARETVRGEHVEVPARVIADLLVVKAEPEVSVALIRHTEGELARGDRFRGHND